MQYRQLGNTGIEVSVVGLGAEHLDNKPYETVKAAIDAAMDCGINLMDMFMPGEAVRTHIGNALVGKRDKIMIQGAIGSVDLREQYDMSRELKDCQLYFENMLRFLKTDYIDLGMLFFLDSHEAIDAMFDNGVVEYAQRLKKEGKVRVLGASAHNPETAIRIVESGVVEMLMFSINPAFDIMPGRGDIAEMLENPMEGLVGVTDPKRAELYRLCQSRGVGITVMKSLGAGKLLSAEHTPFVKPLTVGQCIHYALTRPAVASVLVGCKTPEEVREAVGYVGLSDVERDYSEAISGFRGDGKGGFAGSCVYCNHCLPCPAGIDIAAVNMYLDIARLDEGNIPASVRQHYGALGAHGGDCVGCGSCEGRCPFGVGVMGNMGKAAELFGK